MLKIILSVNLNIAVVYLDANDFSLVKNWKLKFKGESEIIVWVQHKSQRQAN